MNQINQKTLVIGGIVVVAAIAIAIGLYMKGSLSSSAPQEVAMGEPIDIVLDFYGPWLAAVQTGVNPVDSGLATSPILSKELRERLANSNGKTEAGIDAVLCQTKVPDQISSRPISQVEDQAQILVVSRDKTVTEQAVITLNALNGGWYINDIQCSPGEFAPPREFSFDKEGFLLKSVVPPLDPKFWHLVFEENGEQGHVVPLVFSAESKCTTGGTQTVCDPTTFIEPSKVHLQGEMTETGVKVKKVEFLPAE